MDYTKGVLLFTDGACSGNPGPGGWGAILRLGTNEKRMSGGKKIQPITGWSLRL